MDALSLLPVTRIIGILLEGAQVSDMLTTCFLTYSKGVSVALLTNLRQTAACSLNFTPGTKDGSQLTEKQSFPKRNPTE